MKKSPLMRAVVWLCLGFASVRHMPAQQDSPSYVMFQAPGDVCCTRPQSINNAETIAGYVIGANNVDQGFVRLGDGTSHSSTLRGAGTGEYQGTIAMGINMAGTTAGFYSNPDSSAFAFLLTSGGVFTEFSAPGAGSGVDQGTSAESINDGGDTAGFYTDPDGWNHGFVRASDGTITSFNAGDATRGGGTIAVSINDSGAITGYYMDDAGVWHGFVRGIAGTITTFEAPGAGTSSHLGTLAVSINGSGTVTGYYLDANNFAHGFVRAADGTIMTFDAPGATPGTVGGGNLSRRDQLGGHNYGMLRQQRFHSSWICAYQQRRVLDFDNAGAHDQSTYGFAINDFGYIAGELNGYPAASGDNMGC